MAEGYIPNPRRDEGIAYLTSSWPTSTSFDGSVRKYCGVANVNARMIDTNVATIAQGTITVIPVGYRPSVNIPLMAVAKLSGIDTKIAIPVWLYIDGTMPVSFSSSRKLEEVTIVGSYPVA